MLSVNGLVLIDAPHSALNNAGIDPGARTENTVAVKTIRRGREVFPYVSGQAWRYWWRTTLAEEIGWTLSPVTKVERKNQAFTKADPFAYPDDDVFGYMRAIKSKAEATLTRVSPLKCSPLVSAFPQLPTTDFGVMARHGGHPVTYNHEFYSTILKGIFSLDLTRLGRFEMDERTGYKNLDKNYVEKEIKASVEESGAQEDTARRLWTLPVDVRAKRAADTLAALKVLHGGAKHTTHLTDVVPKLIVLTCVEGGNHLFMNVAASGDGEPLIKTDALESVLLDYRDLLKTPVFIGRTVGFADDLAEPLANLQKALAGQVDVRIGSVVAAIDAFSQLLPDLVKQA